MIAKGKSIGHGAAMAEYALNKEKAQFVCSRGLPEFIEPEAMWERMMNHQAQMVSQKSCGRAIKNKALRFEMSPTNEDTEGWSIDDWKELAMDFIRQLDSVDHLKDRPKSKFKPTNLMNSMYLVSLHRDSKSGILHLHILANRVDDMGITNDAHFIGRRAAQAANEITRQRGWVQAEDRRKENITQITNDCFDLLLRMKRFRWEDYEDGIKAKGYDIKLKRDSKDKVVGYTIRKGHSTYKASELGGARQLNASRLQKTWETFHPSKPKTSATSAIRNQPSAVMPNVSGNAARNEHPNEQNESRSYYFTFNLDGKTFKAGMNHATFNELNNAFDISVLEDGAVTMSSSAKVAVLLFAECLDAATSISESAGGGGCTPDKGWGRDEDEDDLKWLRRCIQQAKTMCKPIRKGRGM